ncbi:MAG: nucleotidyltransferase domain-containing protein [Candidatus Schekmanbacteria bacterium]|nr:nucleotidyltransferase domain-containing protein [Candidatus Schekmanbacteria bacterium]
MAIGKTGGKLNQTGLSPEETDLLCSVFRRYPKIERIILFGSRAKGTAQFNSDIDLAVVGIGDELLVEKIAIDLEELPLPYKFDVKSLAGIKNQALIDHVNRVGITVYEIVGNAHTKTAQSLEVVG